MIVLGATCLFAQAAGVELQLYATNFQDWDAVASSTTPTTKTVTTNGSNETLTFTFAEVQIAPDGTNAKFTNTEVITTGYAMAAKTATPYIETTVLSNVSKVSYVHAATGGSRGWGLQCKSPDATEWETLSSDFCAQAGTRVDIEVNRENVQLRWYNLNGSQNAYMTEMAIYGNVERAFTDFEIDLTQNPAVLPEGVTEISQSGYNGAQHGWMDYTLSFKVDGPVKMTFGGCQYANKPATVKSGTTGEELASIDIKTPGCYHNGGTATWVYNVEQADSLVVYLGQYSPYFKAEACAYVPDYVVTYFDQNDQLLGRDTVQPGTPFASKYTMADLTIAEGMAFRGWVNADGIKQAEGSSIQSDLRLYAKVTAIETAETGKYYTYDLSKPNWYQEDHECIAITNGTYHSNHGWDIKPNGTIRLSVGGKAYIQVKNCAYSKEGEATVTALSTGEVITTFRPLVAADGKDTTFFYNGAADTLLITFANEAYIHGVSIFNVSDAIERHESGYYIIPAGDASSLILTLMQLQKGDRVFLPNGVYDLGEKVLTQISADSISLIGQSMAHTIIRNAPDASTESINNTATLLLTGNYCYLQDLTLQNALDYYKANNGRAVALQDKATGTICKNVRLLSYQDTYYSNKIGAVRYFEGGSIHGTVDYICGDGSVYFQGVELYCEKRSANGGGSDAVTASNADASDKGYVFHQCTLRSECPTVSLGRSWNNAPQCVFLHTTFDYSAGNFSVVDGSKIMRWTVEGMNVVPARFGEYNSMDVDGNVISPASNIVPFYKNADKKEMETILTAEEADTYAYARFFGDWNPAQDAAQVALTYALKDGAVQWEPTDATLFLIEDGAGFTLTTTLPATLSEGMTVRAANARGGFGEAAFDKEDTSISATTATVQSAQKIMRDGQMYILHAGVLYNVLGNIVAE